MGILWAHTGAIGLRPLRYSVYHNYDKHQLHEPSFIIILLPHIAYNVMYSYLCLINNILFVAADSAGVQASSDFIPTILVEMYSKTLLNEDDLKKMIPAITQSITTCVIEHNHKNKQDFK